MGEPQAPSRSRLRVGGADADLHAEQRPVGERHASPDVRVQGAHDALELDRGPAGIEQAVRRADLLRVGDALLDLLEERRSSSSARTSSSPPSSERRGASEP